MKKSSLLGRIVAVVVLLVVGVFIFSIFMTPASDTAYFFPSPGVYEGAPDQKPAAEAVEGTLERVQTQAF